MAISREPGLRREGTIRSGKRKEQSTGTNKVSRAEPYHTVGVNWKLRISHQAYSTKYFTQTDG